MLHDNTFSLMIGFISYRHKSTKSNFVIVNVRTWTKYKTLKLVEDTTKGMWGFNNERLFFIHYQDVKLRKIQSHGWIIWLTARPRYRVLMFRNSTEQLTLSYAEHHSDRTSNDSDHGPQLILITSAIDEFTLTAGVYLPGSAWLQWVWRLFVTRLALVSSICRNKSLICHMICVFDLKKNRIVNRGKSYSPHFHHGQE